MTAKQPLEAAQAGEDDLFGEAVTWQARLREPAGEALAAERRAAFRAWLAADPRHREASEAAERLWGALYAPTAELISEERMPEKERRTGVPFSRSRRAGGLRRVAALAASLLVALGSGGLLYYQELVDILRSDLVTSVGERMPQVLADGSRITLNTDTAVALNLDDAQRHVELFHGEAWFEVAADGTRPFVVETPLGGVRVTGTKFDVRMKDGKAIVSVVEGRVELVRTGAAATQKLIVLAAGQQAGLTHGGISVPTPFDATAVTAWLRGQFVFYDTPLAEVIAELNRYRSGRIVIADGGLETLRVSGVFKTDDPDVVLAVISDILGVEATRLTDYLVLLH